jgi:hypothetical protein
LTTVLLIAALLTSAPCTKAHTLLTSTPAPCDGLLVSESSAKKALQCLDVDIRSCEAGLEATRKRAAVTETALREREDIQRRRAEALEQKILDIVADPLPVPGWYEHPAVWFAAGVVLTGAAGVAALHYLDD